ncbi:MAG: hypothetical protein ABIJ86_03040, partial [Spirochaetota bacterium]
PEVNWKQLTKELICAAKTADTPIIVLDLQELRILVGVSQTPDHLLLHLYHRFELMKQKGTALIRVSLGKTKEYESAYQQ